MTDLLTRLRARIAPLVDTSALLLGALGDKNAWLLATIGAAVVGLSDWRMMLTLLQWGAFAMAIAGLSIVVSRVFFPQIRLADLVRRVEAGELPAALVVLGLLLFCGLLFVGVVMWAK